MTDVDLTQLRTMIADLDGYIERRAQQIAGPRIAVVEETSAAMVDQARLEQDQQHQRDSDLIAEFRRQIAGLERRLQRAQAQLRASGAAVYGRWPDLDGEPSASDPAAQVLRWLGQLMPPWPADQQLLASVTSFRAPFDARVATDYECHPSPSSRNLPLGALFRALEAVAGHDPYASAHDVLIAVRNVMAGHGVAEAAAGIAEQDRRMAELDESFRG